MKILILGGTSMIGHRLWLDLSVKHDVVATVRKKPSNIDLDCLEGLDAFDFRTIENSIQEVKPDMVINCIGIIKQLDASKNHIFSIEMNSLLPHRIAAVCEKVGARMIQFGTDCVFSGLKGNYFEDDKVDAQDLYGKSKFLGEIDYMENVFTFRTSFIGRELKPKGGLLEWFLSQNNNEINGFSKAIYSGVSTRQVARIIDNFILEANLHGTYHIASNPISKYDLLQRVSSEFGMNVKIKPKDDFVNDKSLNCSKFQSLTGFTPPSWESMISELNIDKHLYLNI